MRLIPILLIAGTALARDFDADAVLPAGSHRIDAPWRVVADGITLDLGEAELTGPQADGDPDGFTGIALLVEGRRKVTIRGGRLRGFKCAILVRDCAQVVLEGIDVSGNFRQRLKSTPEREDTSDWLWPHENDEQQWRKNYGAGICLENCTECVVRECVGRKQQNGVLLDRCTKCEIYDNDCSFNSGWGLALWRSSGNLVCRNSFDWCVRGYSHGVYDRGQDSAGILVFEQCSENVFAENSATHGGDGFFLYAGHETTRRTGKGGCNDNLLIRNDFSHAVANAIEATFSRGNHFEDNRCDDSNYGVWAGYSYQTRIEGNEFRANSIAGVAIEHGMDNEIVVNTFERNPKGIWLWWDDDEELLASAFGRARPCRSEGYTIVGNVFRGDRVALFLRDTSKVAHANHLEGVAEPIRLEGRCEAITEGGEFPYEPPRWPGELPGRRDPRLPADHPRGRKHILVDEWGPLDPGESAVFPTEVTGWGACVFHVLGPSADYRVEGLPEGLEVEKGARSFRVRGGEGLTEFVAAVLVGRDLFPVRGLLLNATWRVRHWAWENDPREGTEAWSVLLASKPRAEFESAGLDWTWGSGTPHEGVPADRFATRAETKMRLPAGIYEIRTVSDDGVRVLIDGKEVQSDWTWHAPRENRSRVELDEGEHEIVVEHFEIDGYAILRFDLRPVRE